MEQREDAPSETPSDPVDEEPDRSVVERYFWPLLLVAILTGAAASIAIAYTQYGRVAKALQATPLITSSGSLPYADQVVRVLPYVRADSSGGEGPRNYGSFTRMKGLVVNPAGSAGNRYLAVSLAFESDESSVMQELSEKKIVVRDAVLTLLSQRTVEELSDPDQRDELKQILLKETNRILRQGRVDRLYFTEFVLQ